MGDLWKVVNALDHEMVVEKYDLAGRPVETRDPNGVLTRMSYHPRGWLEAQTVFGPNSGSSTDDATTEIVYDDVGQVLQLIAPEGIETNFTYDEAHRLTAVTDGAGSTVLITIDDEENATSEETFDSQSPPVGVHQRDEARNEFGEPAIYTDANDEEYELSYDERGLLEQVEDPLGRLSKYSFDEIGRLQQSITNDAGSGGERAVVEFSYDALDRLTGVLDPNLLMTSYAYDGFGDVVEVDSPDSGVSAFEYDAAGNRVESADGNGKVLEYEYDLLNRIVDVDAVSSPDQAFAWDVAATSCQTGEDFAVGRLALMSDASGSTEFCWDGRGNLVRKVQDVTGTTAASTVVYQYDLADQLVAMTYPSGATVTFGRDADTGRIVSVSGKATPSAGSSTTWIDSVEYLPFGPVAQIDFAPISRSLAKAYDLNYRIDEITSGTDFAIDYTLDEVGNVTGLSEQTTVSGSPEIRVIGYDGLDRVESLHEGMTLVQGFTYDATGNRLSKTTSGGTANYSYVSDSHKLSSDGANARNPNAGGSSTTLGSTKSFTYDDYGRMATFSLNSTLRNTYVYNARGERVGRWDDPTPSNDVVFVYDEGGHILGEYETDGTRIREYVWMDDTPVVIFSGPVGSTTTEYVLTDHLNTPRAVVDGNDTIVWRWDLTGTAFGEHAVNADPDADSSDYTLNLRYPGQYFDTDTGLHQNYFRDYDPGTGRYLQSDPIGLGGGISSFSYSRNSPQNHSDPLGLLPNQYFTSHEDAAIDLFMYLSHHSGANDWFNGEAEGGSWLQRYGSCWFYEAIDEGGSHRGNARARPGDFGGYLHTHTMKPHSLENRIRPSMPGDVYGDPEAGDTSPRNRAYFGEQYVGSYRNVATLPDGRVVGQAVLFYIDPKTGEFWEVPLRDVKSVPQVQCECGQ